MTLYDDEVHHVLSTIIVSEARGSEYVTVPVKWLEVDSRYSHEKCEQIAKDVNHKFRLSPQIWHGWHVTYAPDLRVFIAVTRAHVMKLKELDRRLSYVLEPSQGVFSLR